MTFSNIGSPHLSAWLVISTLAVITNIVPRVDSSTVPCPGFESEPFHNKPLSERPELAKILQNGFQMSLQQAALPSLASPGNRVTLHSAFVDRPFRTVSADYCWAPLMSNPDEFIRCTKSGSASFESSGTAGFPTLVTEQGILQVGLSSDMAYPRILESPFRDDWTAWRESVQQTFASEFECTDWGYLRMTLKDYSCVVTTLCQEFDSEFLADLNELPSEPIPFGNTTGLESYRSFVEKWGSGAVNRFRLGGASLQVTTNQPDGPNTTVYMGYVGGRGIHEIMESNLNASIYTDEDCQDPEPVEVNYMRWDEFLNDFQTANYLDKINRWKMIYNQSDSEDALVPERSTVAQNFFQLALQESQAFSQYLYDTPELFSPSCVESSFTPTGPSSVPPSTAPTMASPSTSVPTNLRTASPSKNEKLSLEPTADAISPGSGISNAWLHPVLLWIAVSSAMVSFL